MNASVYPTGNISAYSIIVFKLSIHLDIKLCDDFKASLFLPRSTMDFAVQCIFKVSAS